MPDLTGHSLGRYHILEQLGEGGMATVYKAYDTRLERDVAVKVIRVDQFNDALMGDVLKRFEREAKALARLTHSNIVHVNDYGEHDGVPFLVMDFLPGGTLKERMRQPMPWQAAVRLLLPILSALEYAHEHKVIHRDVKPANILLTEKGQPMLTDFGIAKILETEVGQTLTGAGVGIGTPEYMAPEQALGKPIDARVDIYSLGIVLYELLTGRRPYTADTPMAVIFKHISDPLPAPSQFVPDLPQAVERILIKALAKEPEERYEDAHAFAQALENLLQTSQTVNSPAAQARPAAVVSNTAAPAARIPTQNTPAPVRAAPLTQPPSQVKLAAPTTGRTSTSALPDTARSGSSARWIGLGVGGVLLFGALFALVLVGWLLTGGAGRLFASNTPAAMADLTQVGKDGMTMLYVPAGQFSMGSEDGDSDEKPVHTVTLDAFWIDRTEVTNSMYAQCVAAGACQAPDLKKFYLRRNYYSDAVYADYPVIYVSWKHAQAYCAWAGRRLPTEAEWEKAARGVNANIYPWGNTAVDGNLLDYNNNVGDTTQVGAYPSGASPYGALDMSGNVWEWVNDWYAATYYQVSPASNPPGAASGSYRVLRGGSWKDDSGNVRASDRNWVNPDSILNTLGFRCASSQ